VQYLLLSLQLRYIAFRRSSQQSQSHKRNQSRLSSQSNQSHHTKEGIDMIVLKIIFFPLWFLVWILKAPARKKARRQRDLEKWGCEFTKEQRKSMEYFDKYYR